VMAATYASTVLAFAPSGPANALRRRVLALASRAAAECGDADLRGPIEMASGMHQLFAGHWQQAQRDIQAALPPLTRQGRYGPEQDTAEQLLLISHERTGQLIDMRTLADRLYEQGELLGIDAAVGKNAIWRALAALADDRSDNALR